MSAKHGLPPVQLKEGSGLLKIKSGGQHVDHFMTVKMQLDE